MSEGMKPNHFDKVMLVAEIARLETLAEAERTAKEQAAKANVEMAKMLKESSQKMFRAMNFPLDKIPLLVQSIKPWITENNRDAFEQVIADPVFVQALGIGIKAFFVEVLNGPQHEA